MSNGIGPGGGVISEHKYHALFIAEFEPNRLFDLSNNSANQQPLCLLSPVAGRRQRRHSGPDSGTWYNICCFDLVEAASGKFVPSSGDGTGTAGRNLNNCCGGAYHEPIAEGASR